MHSTHKLWNIQAIIKSLHHNNLFSVYALKTIDFQVWLNLIFNSPLGLKTCIIKIKCASWEHGHAAHGVCCLNLSSDLGSHTKFKPN